MFVMNFYDKLLTNFENHFVLIHNILKISPLKKEMFHFGPS